MSAHRSVNEPVIVKHVRSSRSMASDANQWQETTSQPKPERTVLNAAKSSNSSLMINRKFQNPLMLKAKTKVMFC